MGVLSIGVLFFVLAIGRPAYAVDPSESLAELSHSQWTAREGAPPEPYPIVQTTDGYIWIGSTAGPYRFDGVRFEPLTLADGTRPLNTSVSALYASPSGDLWIGMRFAGIYVLHDGVLKKYAEDQGLPHRTVWKILMRDDGSMWATLSTGLWHLVGDKWQEVRSDWGYPGGHPVNLYADVKGTLFVRGPEGTFSLSHDAKSFVKTNLSGNISPLDYQFTGSDGVAWDLQGAAFESTSGPPRSLKLGALGLAATEGGYQDKDGSLWVLGLNADNSDLLVRLSNPSSLTGFSSKAPDAVVQTLNPTQFLTGSLHQLLEDREGNIWLTTSNGIDMFRSNKLHSISNGSAVLETSAMTLNAQGDVWLVNNVRATLFSHSDLKPISSSNYMVEAIFSNSLSEADGSVLIAANHHTLLRLANGKIEDVLSAPNSKGIGSRGVIRDGDGSLWLSAVSDGLYRLKDGAWTLNGGLPGLPHDVPLKLILDSAGGLWAGYQGNRIAVIQHEAVRLLGRENGLNVDEVLAIEPRGDRVWVGGSENLMFYGGDRFSPVKMLDGSSFTGVFGIVQDDAGALWLAGNAGVTYISAAEINGFLQDHERRVISETWNYEDGLKGFAPILVPYPAIMKANDGLIWISTTAGVYWIDPKHIRRNSIAPPVIVQSVIAGGKTYPAQAETSLPQHTTSFEIDYTALSFAIPKRVHFKYKLEGVDKSYQDAGARRQAFYTNVPPGAHVFRVIAANEDNLWNETGAAMSITSPPAFYQTRWFYTLCSLGVLGILWQIYRLRLRQIRGRLGERLLERERIARELHDTLIQSAQGLILIFQGFAGQLPKPDPMRKNMEIALDQADSLLNEARERVTDLRTSGLDGDVVQALTRAGEDLFLNTPIHFSIVTSGKPRLLTSAAADDIFRIGREALTNVLQHAQAKTVEVEAAFEPAQFRLRIRDDGVGVSPEVMQRGARPNHFGLQGMRERAERVGGRLEFWSRENAGTEIDLKVPATVYRDSPPRSGWIPAFFLPRPPAD
jgi:signal transduction histidine kinase/ligand-binding sensor domain-containing protein